MEDIARITRAAGYCSVQDVSRVGWRLYGIAPSGFLVETLATESRLALGTSSVTTFEFMLRGPRWEILSDLQFAISGSEDSWRLNGSTIVSGTSYTAAPGDILEGLYLRGSSVSYLSIAAELNVRCAYGSRSMHSSSPLVDFDLQADVVLKGKPAVRAVDQQIITLRPESSLKLLRAPESDCILQWKKLCELEWTKSPQSNRMSTLLTGDQISTKYSEIPTAGLIPGMIQLLPDGRLNVIQVDGQTTGGYPRVAFLPDFSRQHLALLPAGTKLRFTEA